MLSNNSHGGAMVAIGGSLGLSAMANFGQYCGIFRHTSQYSGILAKPRSTINNTGQIV
jgi:hypothetical protein